MGQNDYSSSTPTLVPESLRTYRHFLIEEGPVSGPVGYFLSPVMLSNRFTYSFPVEGWHRAKCIASRYDERECHVPDPGHTCGFYAHYRWDEDFYPNIAFKEPDFLRRRADFEHADWVQFTLDLDSKYRNTYLYRPSIPVRAVVEVAGRVVPGTRGVRAEKMKIVALAVDWDKVMWLAPDGRLTLGGEPPRDRAPGMWRVAREVAVHYGAAFYDDYGVMYDEHPRPDVGHLGIEVAEPRLTAEPPVAVFVTNYRRAINAALNIIDEAPTPSAFERALAAKKNRPAPPGTGIDRRRGRVR